MKKLPRVPSELLALAIKDFKTTISQGISIDMRVWGLFIGEKECSVCLAGSVLLQDEELRNYHSLHGKFRVNKHDLNYDQLDFLDSIRLGLVVEAVEDLTCFCLSGSSLDKLKSLERKNRSYSKEKESQFIDWLEEVQTTLKELGL